VLAPDPIDSSCETKHTHEGACGLLIAGCNSPPLFEPGPEALDDIAVVVDPVGAGDRCLMALRRDRRSGSHAPDVLAEAVAGVAAIGHHPGGHAR
jgi:hypothetical protein